MGDGRIVAPLTRRQIEDIALNVRASLEISADGRVAMQPILEDVLYEVIEGYEFHVREDEQMRGFEGLTDDRKPKIYLANRVHRALERGDGRARFTAAHEFGHLVLHCGMPTYRAFAEVDDPLYDPERQANVFAAAFLMPEQAFRQCRTPREAMKRFGVSLDAVTCRARILRHRLEPDRPVLRLKPKKKGGSSRRTP